MTRLERAIGAVAPGWALRRARARLELGTLERFREHQTRRYEGADRSRRTSGWVTFDGSAAAAARGSLGELRSRCRDLRRNNPWAATAVRELTANVIGRGIRPKFTHESDAELRRATELWDEWAGTTECDAAGRETFWGLQAAAAESMIEGGECLIRRRIRRDTDPLPVPLQVQAIEGDYIDSFRDGEVDARGARVVQGIAFSSIGRRTGYWLFQDHPGDNYFTGRPRESVFVPAEGVLHFYRAERLGQVRGIAWGAPIVLRLHDFDAYEDAEATRMVVAGSFSAFVRDLSPDATFKPSDMLGGSIQGQNAKGQPIDQIESGTVEYLPPGKTIEFPNLPQNEGFPAYSTVQLRGIAKGYGLPYWLLTGDLASVTFSSIRGDWVAFQTNLQTIRDRVVIPHFCDPVTRWWRMAAELSDKLTPGEEDPDRIRWEWIPPRREMLDPRTEVTAEIAGVRAGFKSLSGVVQSLGSDPDRVLQALAEDLTKARRLGLTLDTDGAVPDPGRIPGSNSAGTGRQKQEEEQDDRYLRVLLALLERRGMRRASALDVLVGPLANGIGGE